MIPLTVQKRVFSASGLLVVMFLVLTFWNLSETGRLTELIQRSIVNHCGWFLVLIVNVYLVMVGYLIFGKPGTIRIGGDRAAPEFSYWSWMSMLFSAGMGIGLVFYSVAEPILHYDAPPTGQGKTWSAAEQAMTLTFFHWGLHAWAIYALMALGLAYFAFNEKRPLVVRSAFYPLLGGRVDGWMGDVIDVLATVSTLFGLATSLGLGATQINAGLNYLIGLPQDLRVQAALILGITLMAICSLVLGLKRGIRRLSEINVIAAFALMTFVFLWGPTLFLLRAFVQNIGSYLSRMPDLSLWTSAYGTSAEWQSSWTVFYWAWWIAWSPFVGIFVARISYGRTVREFLCGALLVPTLLTFVWLTVFGNTALWVELMGTGGIVETVQANLATAMFFLLDQFPLAPFACALGVLVVTVFFVTSSDSASMVVDIITSGGHLNPPIIQRIFWASVEGMIAMVLLLGGGLQALQSAVIVTGLPFSIVLFLMGLSLIKALNLEVSRRVRSGPSATTGGR